MMITFQSKSNTDKKITFSISDGSVLDCDGPQPDPVLPQPVWVPPHPLGPGHRAHAALLRPLHAVLPQGLLKEEGREKDRKKIAIKIENKNEHEIKNKLK
jgi:hypothetical protein